MQKEEEVTGVTGKFDLTGSRAKPNRVLSRQHTDKRKHSFPTTQEMILHMDIIRWSIPKSD